MLTYKLGQPSSALHGSSFDNPNPPRLVSNNYLIFKPVANPLTMINHKRFDCILEKPLSIATAAAVFPQR